MNGKNIILIIIVLAIIGGIGYVFMSNTQPAETIPTIDSEEVLPVEPDNGIGDGAAPLEEKPTAERGDKTVIGTSVAGNEITAYHFGTGDTELLFVGGAHGGYSWNTALLAYQMIDYYDAHANEIPDDVTITVIPVLNPDGLKNTVGTVGRFEIADALKVSESTRVAGRFNAHEVDLNRNFDCEWSTTGVWQNREVSGGSKVFSEPEAVALRDYVSNHKPAAAIVWFSSEGKVYPSACGGAPSSKSVTLAATFASAADYSAAAEFDAYTITGDMVNWMAKQGIPAISVLLTNHQNTEWDKNIAGVRAVVSAYTKK